MLLQRFSRQPIGASLVVLYLLGLYTYVTLRLAPGIPIPATVAAIAGALLLLFNVQRIRLRHLAWMALFVALAFASVLFAHNPGSFMGERLKSFFYISYSLATGYGLYLELTKWDRDEVSRLFLIAILAMLAGCFLEVFTPFRYVSDVFREAVFEFTYNADARDIHLTGRVRPKLFTAEPSHLAKFLLLSLTAWLGLSRARRKYLWFAAFAALALVLVRSPILILALPMAVLNRVYVDGGGVRALFRDQGVRELAGVAALTAAVAVLGMAVMLTVFAPRVTAMLEGQDRSTSLRLLAGPLIAVEAIRKDPFWGVGIGGKEAVVQEMEGVFMLFGVDPGRFGADLADQMFNAFWIHWTYFGLFGGTVILLVGIQLLRSLGMHHLMYVGLVLLMLSQTMGAYVGVRTWSYVYIMVVVSILVHRHPLSVWQDHDGSAAEGRSLEPMAPLAGAGG